METKPNIRQLSREELGKYLTAAGEKPFRAGQVYDWLWLHHAGSFEEMSNLSKTLRERLSADFSLPALRVDATQHSADGTIKSRFRLPDGHLVEGVLIPTATRQTACVSSQVGCSLSCRFCATGFMDRKRNLSFDEIVDEVALINRQSQETFGKKLTNIVYMGMGEPLLNYRQVMRSIERITSPEGMAMSPRRITVSTAGVAKMIRQLGDDKVRFNLALSLHAANDKKRSEIMPVNDNNNLKALTEALNYFYRETRNDITFEYILFRNFNDTLKDADELIRLYRQVPVKVVNLIEYNPVDHTPFAKPDEAQVTAFMQYLEKHRVNARIRHSRGKDIDAACGQLANK
ncbi:23S rRNA (adenine(2503)-C(2))-methyltransferase RlmN [Compostibacter hankyongensis]|uniref:Probable dual-specificity RNA methyltransferase RlmN n=1 Tax=Compostibacter hankyongensis TaxID=1007089 RepID=A0ABP8GA14_9BACT